MALGVPVDGDVGHPGDALGHAMLAAVEFHVDVTRERGSVCVRPVGEVDVATIEGLHDRIKEALTAGVDRVILDLRAATFLDSSGLHLVEDTDSWARRNSIDFAIIAGPPTVQRTFDAVGLTERLSFVDGDHRTGLSDASYS